MLIGIYLFYENWSTETFRNFQKEKRYRIASFMEDILYRSRCGKTNVKILAPKKVYAADLGVRTLYTGFRDIGSLFENYVYLKIKHINPCYVYEGGAEIDFVTSEKTLIEVKYHSPMTKKQQDLFNTYPAKKKVILTGIKDLEGIKL
jgi:hypothetical protein